MRYLIIVVFCLFADAFCSMAQTINPVSDLPLQLSNTFGTKEALVIYLMGDGGWNSYNQQIVQEFEKHGYGVVAFNCRKYFWSEKSPDVFAQDIEQLAKYYLKEWHKSSLIIVGYSFGADVASFLPGRLSVDLQKKINKIALFSPSASSDFVIRLSDMMGGTENVNRKYKVGPEIAKADLPFVIIFGKDEVMMLKNSLPKRKNLTIYEVPGDHRYNNNFPILLEMMGM